MEAPFIETNEATFNPKSSVYRVKIEIITFKVAPKGLLDFWSFRSSEFFGDIVVRDHGS